MRVHIYIYTYISIYVYTYAYTYKHTQSENTFSSKRAPHLIQIPPPHSCLILRHPIQFHARHCNSRHRDMIHPFFSFNWSSGPAH